MIRFIKRIRVDKCLKKVDDEKIFNDYFSVLVLFFNGGFCGVQQNTRTNEYS